MPGVRRLPEIAAAATSSRVVPAAGGIEPNEPTAAR